MTRAVTITAVPLLLLAAMTAPLARAQDRHPHPAAAVARAAPAQRWATDVPLRTGMGRIRAAVGALRRYEQGHVAPAQAVAAAGQIQAQVAYLVAHCKLGPQADSDLHGIIAALGTGA